MALINIEIDGFSRSIVEVATGATFATRIVAWSDLTAHQITTTIGWQFDWLAEAQDVSHGVFGLLLTRGRTLQGLVSMMDAEDHVFVNLIESAPANFGKGKRYRGVPANLFAFACLRSQLLGFEGAVGMVAKTELIEHYESSLGAKRLGAGNRMAIEANAANELIRMYFSKESDQWPV